MASNFPSPQSGSDGFRPAAASAAPSDNLLLMLLKPVASLKITVVLFVMLIFLLFVGTLAQAEEAMWSAVARYFHSPYVWITLNTFPTAFGYDLGIPDFVGFPFLGGGAIGVLLLVNLLAAHLIRFKIQATGTRLAGGLFVLGLGMFFTMFIIGGHILFQAMTGSKNTGGLQDIPWFVEVNGGDWLVFWQAIKFMILPLAMMTAIGGAIACFSSNRRKIEAILLTGLSAPMLIGVFLLFFVYPDVRLDDSALRILWLLLQSTMAGLVLLAGCILVFKQRGGIVVLHGGVILLVLGMFFVALYAVEEQMTLAEGQSSSAAQDIREVELAVVDRSGEQFDAVIAIPQSRLESKQRISHERLPFDVEMVELMANSEIVEYEGGGPNRATRGMGRRFVARPKRVSAGADAGGKVDDASVYVRLSQGGKKLGTYLFSQAALAAEMSAQDERMPPERITVDGKTYDVYLRFKTTYKPYTIQLVDVRKDDYMGTDTPMNYSSDILLFSGEDGDDSEGRKVKIWMNNPLRYGGETFYQTSYFSDGQTEYTQLSIVTNTSWMVPYLGCMIVAIGLGAHFWIVLVRFLNRVATGELAGGSGAAADPQGAVGRPIKPGRPSRRRQRDEVGTSAALSAAGIIAPTIAVAVGLICIAYSARVPAVGAKQIDTNAAGMLPVVYQGRVKPLDTLARNMLRIISDKETFYDESGGDGRYVPSDDDDSDTSSNGSTQPAMRWLLDVVSDHPDARHHKVFRIDNLEVLAVLDLKRRKGFRYSVSELSDNIGDFEKQVRRVRKMDAENLGTFERKLIEADRRIRTYTKLLGAFQPHRALPPLPTPEELRANPGMARRKIVTFMEGVREAKRAVNSTQPPLVVPGEKADDSWQPLSNKALDRFVLETVLGEEVDENTKSWDAMLAAYANDDAEKFNELVASYRQSLATNPPQDVSMVKVDREAFYNNFNPFLVCRVLYIVAFVATCVGLLCAMFHWNMPFNRAAMALLILTFVIHSLALLARMYISGRPPVTNLYSSAVAIGWLAVAFGIGIEMLTRLGIGNIVSSVSGISTTIIAYNLAGDGDTMAVLQAVLDTQFWLATHVVAITAGYATTFVAGLLGIIFILLGLFTPMLDKSVERIIYKITFGTVCFAMFFSFFGTVLGGLWADDSWGRFWGWDPKENGALIIVLWNAVMLHARWANLIKARGFAVLAVVGNIVTAWSWFGVNELGVGLHSYGFTEGVMLALVLFAFSQLAIISIGMLPKDLWSSYRNQQQPLRHQE